MRSRLRYTHRMSERFERSKDYGSRNKRVCIQDHWKKSDKLKTAYKKKHQLSHNLVPASSKPVSESTFTTSASHPGPTPSSDGCFCSSIRLSHEILASRLIQLLQQLGHTLPSITHEHWVIDRVAFFPLPLRWPMAHHGPDARRGSAQRETHPNAVFMVDLQFTYEGSAAAVAGQWERGPCWEIWQPAKNVAKVAHAHELRMWHDRPMQLWEISCRIITHHSYSLFGVFISPYKSAITYEIVSCIMPHIVAMYGQ